MLQSRTQLCATGSMRVLVASVSIRPSCDSVCLAGSWRPLRCITGHTINGSVRVNCRPRSRRKRSSWQSWTACGVQIVSRGPSMRAGIGRAPLPCVASTRWPILNRILHLFGLTSHRMQAILEQRLHALDERFRGRSFGSKLASFESALRVNVDPLARTEAALSYLFGMRNLHRKCILTASDAMDTVIAEANSCPAFSDNSHKGMGVGTSNSAVTEAEKKPGCGSAASIPGEDDYLL